VKYVCRAGRKDATKKIEDLEKAKDYLENEIRRLEEEDD
jgi:ribosome recycling factor